MFRQVTLAAGDSAAAGSLIFIALVVCVGFPGLVMLFFSCTPDMDT